MREKHERPWLQGAKAAVGETSQQVDSTAPSQPTTASIPPLRDCQPEAAELPEGVVILADALRELVAILPGLKAALDRRPRVEPLAYRLEELADALGVSRRVLERERSAGRLPKADLYIGKMPLYRVESVRAWLDRGGR